jgi:hypothetical protein
MIHGGGFNGIVVIIWGGGTKMMRDKLNVGVLSKDIGPQLKFIAIKVIGIVAKNKGKLYCIGLMIAAKFNLR